MPAIIVIMMAEVGIANTFLWLRDVIPVKMLLIRMSRSTPGKFVHLVIPFILKLVLHSNEMINLSL
jgi:hypothetical protein